MSHTYKSVTSYNTFSSGCISTSKNMLMNSPGHSKQNCLSLTENIFSKELQKANYAMKCFYQPWTLVISCLYTSISCCSATFSFHIYNWIQNPSLYLAWESWMANAGSDEGTTLHAIYLLSPPGQASYIYITRLLNYKSLSHFTSSQFFPF